MANSLNWLDILIVFIILIYALDGLLKGLILSLFKTVGFFIAIYAARVVAPIAVDYILKDTQIYNGLYGYIHPRVTDNISAAAAFNTTIINKGNTSDTLTSILITIGVFILVFVLLRVILSLVANTLNMTARIPVIKQFNKIGGFILGVVKGVFVLYIVFAVLILFSPLIPEDSTVISAVNSSLFAYNFYKYNIIVQWISNIFH